MVDLAGRHQPEEGPCRLRSRTRSVLITAIVELLACSALAPSAVGILDPDEPRDRLAEFGRSLIDAGGIERTQDRPGPVDVVHAPAAVPASLLHLSTAQIIDRA